MCICYRSEIVRFLSAFSVLPISSTLFSKGKSLSCERTRASTVPCSPIPVAVDFGSFGRLYAGIGFSNDWNILCILLSVYEQISIIPLPCDYLDSNLPDAVRFLLSRSESSLLKAAEVADSDCDALFSPIRDRKLPGPVGGAFQSRSLVGPTSDLPLRGPSLAIARGADGVDGGNNFPVDAGASGVRFSAN